MSLKLEHGSNWSATEFEMSLKLNVIKIKMSLNIECHSNLNVIQIGMSLKF